MVTRTVKRKYALPEQCKHCGIWFSPRLDLKSRGLGIYCSTRCSNIGRRQQFSASKEVLLSAYRQIKSIHKTAKHFGVGWKTLYRRMKELGINTSVGVWRQEKGYITLYRSGSKRRAKRAVVIAEEKYGRRLSRWEVVHHVDGNRQNDSPQNLAILSQKLHTVHHHQLDKIAYRLIQSKLIQYDERDGYTISHRLEEVLDGNK